MFLKKRFAFLWAGTAFAAVALAQTPPAQPDNTKMNKGDASNAAVTADKQKMNTSDRDLTQKIRKSVMAEKSLSTYAHNVKIVSQNGKVTLKGPVRSEEEKQTVASKAAEIAGAGNVDNQLSVKPEASK
jgi:hyperosmotically inducible periplasmic protein